MMTAMMIRTLIITPTEMTIIIVAESLPPPDTSIISYKSLFNSNRPTTKHHTFVTFEFQLTSVNVCDSV